MSTRNVALGQLQTVINAAVAGDILNLAAGIHTGSVTVNKKLTIDGLGAATISGPNNTVLIRADGITLKNVTVTGSSGNPNALINQTYPNLTLDNVKLIGTGAPADANRTVYGIRNYQTGKVTVIGGEWAHLAVGVSWERGGAGSVVDGVDIHDIDHMVVNDTTPGTDTGANPFAFYHAVGPITVRRNTIRNIRAASADYGADGSAFEFFGSGTGGVLIENNEVHDSLLIAETGKAAGDADYDAVTFRGNRFYGKPNFTPANSTQACNGLYLRSAKNWVIEDNEFHDLDWWVLGFDYSSSQYSGAVSNIVARRNKVWLKPGVNRWLSFGSTVPLTVFTSSDTTVYQPAGSGNVIAEKVGGVKTDVLATWRNAAPGHETGATTWGPEPPVSTCEDDLAAAQAQIAVLTVERDVAEAEAAAATATLVARTSERDAAIAENNRIKALASGAESDLAAAQAKLSQV